MKEIINYEDKSSIKLKLLNWDEEYKKDRILGKCFRINQKAFEKDEKLPYGSHSPLFGTDWEDDDAFSDRYRCKCGEMVGTVYEGETCPICKEKVKFIDVRLDFFGWMVLDNHKIIQPSYYEILARVIGKNELKDIISYELKINRNGISNFEYDPKHPYKNIGLVEFRKRFIEILCFYKKKKKDKKKDFRFLLNNIDSVFASAIPVFSSELRPLIFKGENMQYSDIDKIYNPIFSQISSINKISSSKKKQNSPDIIYKLGKLQERIQKLREKVFESINQKDGHIRDQIMGGRINYSARNVIIPDPSLEADEVIMGYMCFMELFKSQIICRLSKLMNITESTAYNEWCLATLTFSPVIYEIMKSIIKETKPMILLNRNPTEFTVGYIVICRNNPFLNAGKSC